jgi:hypothetical protein
MEEWAEQVASGLGSGHVSSRRVLEEDPDPVHLLRLLRPDGERRGEEGAGQRS